MVVLTLESLPDEILMLVFQYCGSTIDILRTFLGLNQRFSNILVDQQLHLLTDYFSLKSANIHYNSNEFQQVISQLVSIRTSMTEEQLDEILQSLYSYSIRQRYLEMKEKIELLCVKFESIRQTLSSDELDRVDSEILNEFSKLQSNPVTSATVQRIKELVFTQGARLNCENYELTKFNVASAINTWIFCDINQNNNNNTQSNISMRLYSQIVQILFISNSNLFDNRGYVGNGGCIVDYFVLYTLFCLQYFYGIRQPTTNVNIKCFQVAVNLFFMILHFRSVNNQNRSRLQAEMIHLLDGIEMPSNHRQIQNIQLEIIKLTFEEIDVQLFSPEEFDYPITSAVKRFITTQRFDILKYFSHQELFHNVLSTPIFIRICINRMTRNRTDRHTFAMLLKDPSTSHIFAQQHVLFILLDKKEHKWLKELLRISPDLVNQLDEQGNDPLLYITLNVSGCRHRIIEMLIKTGCDTERKNTNGQTFRDVLSLPKNRKLLNKLIQYEIIDY